MPQAPRAIVGINTNANRWSSGRRRRRGKVEVSETVDLAASYSRYSTDYQREESISDQQRQCKSLATENGHKLAPDLEFSDHAVSGTKLHRAGLDAMLQAARAGEFKVLYFHSLSRLARESVITMPMLKRLVYNFGIRIISVTEGIDSDRDSWEVIATILSLMHERYIKELGANVFRGQEGAVLAGYSVGDHRFGYKSVPVPGSEKGRKGRDAKPRMIYVIDEVTAPWVVRIFTWFVQERRTVTWIVRELNRRGAPKDHRSTTPEWRHAQVIGTLVSEKYIGSWPWGLMENIRDPETGKLRQEPRSEEETEKWTRQFPHLRIIDDAIFAQASKLLDENFEKFAAGRRRDGTLNWKERGSADSAPAHLLSRLIKCAECEHIFYTGGTHNRYMFCPNYRAGTCSCRTQLRRDRAERLILNAIGEAVLANPDWVQAIHDAMLKAWEDRQRRQPAELVAARRAMADVDQRIARMVDCLEDGLDDPDIMRRLQERRDERRAIAATVKDLEAAVAELSQEPTERWLLDHLQQLGETLKTDTPAAAYALRDLVGGEVLVEEVRPADGGKNYLQGSFAISLGGVARLLSGTAASTEEEGVSSDLVRQFVIDFVEPSPRDEKALRAKQLRDQGHSVQQIAALLECSRSNVTALLKHAYELLGEEKPDGRAHRVKNDPALFEQLADRAMQLYEQGVLIDVIADQLGCDRETARKALKLAHQQRGLQMPDGRERRKSLDHKVRKCQDKDT